MAAPTSTGRSGPAASAERRLALRLRSTFVVLGGVVAAGALGELAMLRHWNGAQQQMPWALSALTLVAAAALYLARGPVTVLVARVVGVVVVLGGGFGSLVHVLHNYDVGPLDAAYEKTWDTLGLAQQVWLAVSGGVGASPPLAPGMLSLAGVLLLIGTLGRSVLDEA